MRIFYRSMKTAVAMAALLVVLRLAVSQAIAQAGATDWNLPVNLSKSGSTRSPRIVQDSQGIIHTLWLDEIAGVVYTRFEGGTWADPIPVDLPFNEIIPELVADSNGYIHAFWVSHDDELLYSRVPAGLIQDSASWEAERILGTGAVRFDVVQGDKNRLFLAYSRKDDDINNPAGVYFRGSISGGTAWDAPILLYSSDYYRALPAELINLHITSTIVNDADHVYVSWDNQPRKRVFMAKSEDGGASWVPADEIDGPDPDTVIVSPFNLLLHVNGRSVLAVWASNLQSDFDCTLYFQSSQDSGATWSKRRSMLTELVGCARDLTFLEGPGDIVVLATTVQQQLYLIAWDGRSWSSPQLQLGISTFEDPETLYMIRLEEPRLYVDPSGQMNMIGSDALESDDIWFTSRAFGEVSAWYPPKSTWTDPELVTESKYTIGEMELVSDIRGVNHAFWIQLDESKEKPEHTVIYHASLNQGEWSKSLPVLKSPEGDANQLSAAVDAENRIYLVWSGGVSGEIYFSWADAALASSKFEWSTPSQLPMVGIAGYYPQILISKTNTMYVSYSVQINEHRGVYILQSLDRGATWLEPIQIFDAATEDWEIVGKTNLGVTADNVMLAQWERQSIPGGLGVQGLYYSTSNDGGITWDVPQLIISTPIYDHWLAVSSDGVVQRIWQSENKNTLTNYYEYSVDRGSSWSALQTLTRFAENPIALSIESDTSGLMHLVQIVQDKNGDYLLEHAVWEGERWLTHESIRLELTDQDISKRLASSIGEDGYLAVLYAALSEQGASVNQIYAARHMAIMADSQTTAQSSPGNTKAPTASIEPTIGADVFPTIAIESTRPVQITPEPKPSATNVAPIPEITLTPASSSNTRTITGIFLGLAVFLLAVVVAVAIYFIKRSRG